MAGFNGIFQGGSDGRLPHHTVEGGGPVFAGGNDVRFGGHSHKSN